VDDWWVVRNPTTGKALWISETTNNIFNTSL
jgi:hypothetical protein